MCPAKDTHHISYVYQHDFGCEESILGTQNEEGFGLKEPGLQEIFIFFEMKECDGDTNASKYSLNLVTFKPYLFMHPTPTNAIISWTISWPAITVFLYCMV